MLYMHPSISLQHAVGKMGTQVIVPYRDEDEARVFKPMGDLGQIVRMVRMPRSLLHSADASNQDRNGISVMKTRLPSVCGTQTLCTTLSEGTSRPSVMSA